MQIMGNKMNAYARLTKVEKARVVETSQVVAIARAIDATTQYPRSFILALSDDLFITQIWSQMCD
jgi:hypothetical protein